MIVMHPDEIAFSCPLRHPLRKDAVPFLISMPGIREEIHSRRKEVEQRPDCLIRIALIKGTALAFREIDGHVFKAVLCFRK